MPPPSSRQEILHRAAHPVSIKKPPVVSVEEKNWCTTRKLVAVCFASVAIIAFGTLFFIIFSSGEGKKYDIEILTYAGYNRRLQQSIQGEEVTSTICGSGVTDTDIVHTDGAATGYIQRNVSLSLLTPYGKDTINTVTNAGDRIKESSSIYYDPQYTFPNGGVKRLRRPLNFFRGCDTPERYFSRCPDVTNMSSCQYTCGIAEIELNFRRRNTLVDEENNGRENKNAVIVAPMINYIKSNKQIAILKIFLENFPKNMCNTTAVWRLVRTDADPGTFEATVLPTDHTSEAYANLFRDPAGYFVDDSDYVWNAGRKQWVGPSTPD